MLYGLSYLVSTAPFIVLPLQEHVFSSKTSLPKTTMTSWRSGLGHSTALLWLDNLQARWFLQSCWAPPTWPSSTSTATIPRTGQGSRWTIKVRLSVMWEPLCLFVCPWRWWVATEAISPEVTLLALPVQWCPLKECRGKRLWFIPQALT